MCLHHQFAERQAQARATAPAASAWPLYEAIKNPLKVLVRDSRSSVTYAHADKARLILHTLGHYRHLSVGRCELERIVNQVCQNTPDFFLIHEHTPRLLDATLEPDALLLS